PVNLQFGQGWRLLVSGVRDLGGNPVAAGAEASGLVAGDAAGPMLLAATQNAFLDPSGATLDLSFDEMVEPGSAEALGDYAASAGQSPLSASVLPPGDLVRVVFDAPLLPGVDTLSAQNVFDLAGNQMAAVSSAAIATTDLLPPSLESASATTMSGFGNDVLSVVFSEAVFPSDASDLARYVLESPAGSPLSLAGAGVAYDAPSRTATIVFSGAGASAVNLRTGASFSLSVSGVRDFAGNPMPPGSSFAGIVGGDAVAPSVISVAQDLAADPFGRVVALLLDEPISLATSPAAFYSASEGQAFVSASELPGSIGIQLAFAEAIVPGSTTITVSGVEDPAGNPGGGTGLSVTGSDFTAPTLLGASATAVEGAANDLVEVDFSEPVVPSDAESPSAYVLESPIGAPIALGGSLFSYDPLLRTVTITLADGVNLQTGATFKISVLAVRDVAGNPMAPSSLSGVVGGDFSPPTVIVADRNEVVDPSSLTVDVTFNEAVEATSAESAANYWFTAKGTPPVLVAAFLLGDQRTVRLVAGSTVIPGTHRLRVRNVRDLAGNIMPTTNNIEITP
ncbi:MAG TPA: Ig-like domain-containing protein, partial [Planctomycetota bacterium]|nr:Ig-like domain-containing protein [Planctomycetota bacterium]